MLRSSGLMAGLEVVQRRPMIRLMGSSRVRSSVDGHAHPVVLDVQDLLSEVVDHEVPGPGALNLDRATSGSRICTSRFRTLAMPLAHNSTSPSATESQK